MSSPLLQNFWRVPSYSRLHCQRLSSLSTSMQLMVSHVDQNICSASYVGLPSMQLMVSHVDQNTCSASYVGLPLVSLSPNPYLTSPHNLHLTQRPLSFERKLGLLRQPRLASHRKCQHYMAELLLSVCFCCLDNLKRTLSKQLGSLAHRSHAAALLARRR